VQRIFGGIQESISKKNIQSDIHFSKLPNVFAKLVAVAGILVYILLWFMPVFSLNVA
jgi:callose synthase